ncbi:DUF6932 family protein [Falsiroseomonas sp.]|uniref:DUF6932 family protein n=1 Tax=Falsiroseomonas sp. TaxID=2870721 RepID=UPI003569CD68
MQLNGDGYLDPGIHAATVADIKTHFVDAFPTSATRETIFEGYKRHTTDLQQCNVAFDQYADGSFVSSKVDPGDIDFVCIADADTIDALPPEKQRIIATLFRGKATKATHQCDAYFIASVPDTDPRHQSYWANRKFWLGCFGFDRADKPKGFLKLQITPSASPSVATAVAGAAGGNSGTGAAP